MHAREEASVGAGGPQKSPSCFDLCGVLRDSSSGQDEHEPLGGERVRRAYRELHGASTQEGCAFRFVHLAPPEGLRTDQAESKPRRMPKERALNTEESRARWQLERTVRP